jgi:secreted trypsin-like serine protease
MKPFLLTIIYFILTPSIVYSSKNSTLHLSGCGLQLVRCEEVSKNEETLCNPNARIVGGGESFKGEFPWLVLLFMRDTRHQFCAGTLLDEKHILTANHCVFE